MIRIDGICDVINTDIGYETEYGNLVAHTEDAIKEADAIFASNRYAYDDLMKNGFKGKLVNFQEYMPWG